MQEGGSVVATSDDDVTSHRQVREMETRIGELERQLGRKTLEVEILKEELERSRPKKCELAHALTAAGEYPVNLIASTLGVGRSTVYDRPTGSTRTRGPYSKAQDADLLSRIRQIAAHRPTYRYRRIAVVLNRQQSAERLASVNRKRIYRIMAADRLLLARRYTKRADYGHDGVVVAMRSNLR